MARYARQSLQARGRGAGKVTERRGTEHRKEPWLRTCMGAVAGPTLFPLPFFFFPDFFPFPFFFFG